MSGSVASVRVEGKRSHELRDTGAWRAIELTSNEAERRFLASRL